jgi:hypothetical protein
MIRSGAPSPGERSQTKWLWVGKSYLRYSRSIGETRFGIRRIHGHSDFFTKSIDAVMPLV